MKLTRPYAASFRLRRRYRKQRRERAAANIIDPRIDDAIALDLEEHRRVKPGAVEFAQHHGEVGALRIPGQFKLRPERNADRRMRSADCDRPLALGGHFVALGEV